MMNRIHLLLLGSSLALFAACGLDPNAPQGPKQLSTGVSGNPTGNATGDPTNGTGSGNPVEACEALEDTLAMCQPALEGALQCSSYDAWPCDLTDYFDCVTDAYGDCQGGTFPNTDPLALQDCAMLTTCN